MPPSDWRTAYAALLDDVVRAVDGVAVSTSPSRPSRTGSPTTAGRCCRAGIPAPGWRWTSSDGLGSARGSAARSTSTRARWSPSCAAGSVMRSQPGCPTRAPSQETV